MSWDDHGSFDEGFGDEQDSSPEAFADHADDWPSEGSLPSASWVRTDSMDDEAFTDDEPDAAGDMADLPLTGLGGIDTSWDEDSGALFADNDRQFADDVDAITEGTNEQWNEHQEWVESQLADDTLQHPEDAQADQQDDEDEHRHDTGPGTR